MSREHEDQQSDVSDEEICILHEASKASGMFLSLDGPEVDTVEEITEREVEWKPRQESSVPSPLYEFGALADLQDVKLIRAAKLFDSHNKHTECLKQTFTLLKSNETAVTDGCEPLQLIRNSHREKLSEMKQISQQMDATKQQQLQIFKTYKHQLSDSKKEVESNAALSIVKVEKSSADLTALSDTVQDLNSKIKNLEKELREAKEEKQQRETELSENIKQHKKTVEEQKTDHEVRMRKLSEIEKKVEKQKIFVEDISYGKNTIDVCKDEEERFIAEVVDTKLQVAQDDLANQQKTVSETVYKHHCEYILKLKEILKTLNDDDSYRYLCYSHLCCPIFAAITTKLKFRCVISPSNNPTEKTEYFIKHTGPSKVKITSVDVAGSLLNGESEWIVSPAASGEAESDCPDHFILQGKEGPLVLDGDSVVIIGIV